MTDVQSRSVGVIDAPQMDRVIGGYGVSEIFDGDMYVILGHPSALRAAAILSIYYGRDSRDALALPIPCSTDDVINGLPIRYEYGLFTTHSSTCPWVHGNDEDGPDSCGCEEYSWFLDELSNQPLPGYQRVAVVSW